VERKKQINYRLKKIGAVSEKEKKFAKDNRQSLVEILKKVSIFHKDIVEYRIVKSKAYSKIVGDYKSFNARFDKFIAVASNKEITDVLHLIYGDIENE
jgi:hypothetical protein